MKIRRAGLLLALLAALLLGLCACRVEGNPLPEGMDEEETLAKGREAVRAIAGNDWEGLWALLREDVRESTSPEDIGTLILGQLDGAGVYKQIDSYLATGQSSDGEDYGVCVFYCKYEKKKALIQLLHEVHPHPKAQGKAVHSAMEAEGGYAVG